MTYRVMQKFWLDLEKPDEETIHHLIDHYKRQRQFSRIIRDGIRLMWSLGQGDLDVLFELFPWVMDAFYQRALAGHKPQDATLTDQLARLEKLLIEQGSVPIDKVEAGPRLLAVPSVPKPLADEDDGELLALKKSAGVSKQASTNFLASAFSLQET